MLKKYEGRKVAGFIAAVCSVFIIFFLLLLHFMNQRVKVIDVSDCERSTGEVVFQIEEVSTFYNYIFVGGYAYIPGEDIDESCIQVLMYDESKDMYYELPTETVKREDVTEDADDGYDYDYSGFRSAAYKSKLPENGRFVLLYQCNGRKILIQEEG